MDNEKHEPDDHREAKSQDEKEEQHVKGEGGFSLNGPIGFGARFPESSAGESKWIIRAIAIAIVILSLCYGWSML